MGGILVKTSVAACSQTKPTGGAHELYQIHLKVRLLLHTYNKEVGKVHTKGVSHGKARKGLLS